jgi:hypothetical protein
MKNNTLGTLTITGKFPIEIDGLFLGYTAKKSIRFYISQDGFIRNNKLYKTLEPNILIDALGIIESNYNFKYNL